VYTSVWTVHHDARYFDRPYDFLPKRWLDPNSNDVKEASQPFSVGPRGCTGRKYAFIMMFHDFLLELLSYSHTFADYSIFLDEQLCEYGDVTHPRQASFHVRYGASG